MTDQEFSTLVNAFVQEYRNKTLLLAFPVRNDGGPGSGNFGHKGVEGQLGGSAPSGGGKYSGLSDEAKSIIKDSVVNPYHFGESQEQKDAKRERLIGELKKAGIQVHYDEEHDTYSAMSTDLSYEENMEMCKALNQAYFSFAGYDRSDYVEACKKEGKTPKLSETPKELEKGFFYTKSGKLQTDGTPVYASLDKEKLLSNKELVRYSGTDKEINPEGAEKAEKAQAEAVENMSDAQRAALHEYTMQYGQANYSAVNNYYKTGEGNEHVQKNAEEIRTALDKEIGVECITARGDSAIYGTSNDKAVGKIVSQIEKGNFSNAGKLEKMLTGQIITNESAMSTSPNDPTSNYGSLPVQLIFKTPADAKAVNITGLSAFGGGRSEVEKALANTGLFGSVEHETEVLYKPGTKYRVDSVRYSCTMDGKKKRGQVYLVCTVLTDRDDSRYDDDWVTINGTHVKINEEGVAESGGKLKGMSFSKAKSIKSSKKESGSKGSGSSSSHSAKNEAWRSKVSEDREAARSMKNNKLALKFYDEGVLDYDTAVEQMRSGEIRATAEHYYDVLEANGDPTPEKETVTEQRSLHGLVGREYGGDWTEARIGEIQKDTGMSREDSEMAQKEIQTWMSNAWGRADTSTLDEYIEKAPAFDGQIHRGLCFTDDEGQYDAFMDVVRGGVIRMNGNSSWSSDQSVARRFAHTEWDDTDSVMITCISNKTATPIEHLANSNGGEDEVIAHSRTSWSVVRVTETEKRDGGRHAHIIVIERGEYDNEQ